MLDSPILDSTVWGSSVLNSTMLRSAVMGSIVRDRPLIDSNLRDGPLLDRLMLDRALRYSSLLEIAVREIIALEGPVLVGCRPEVESRSPSSRRSLYCWNSHWLGAAPGWHTVGHIHPVVREGVPGVRLIHASVGAQAGQLADPFAWMVRNAHIDVVRHGCARVLILVGTTRVGAAHGVVLLKRGINTAHGLRRYD